MQDTFRRACPCSPKLTLNALLSRSFRGQRKKRDCAFRPVDCRQRLPSQLKAQVGESSRDDFIAFLLDTQQNLIKETEALAEDGSKFVIDRWERDASNPNAGYGITSVMESKGLLEKAAVNISVVAGKLSPERAQAMSSRGRDIDDRGGQDYSAAALSLVYHPGHPFVPTLRADIRRFKVGSCTWFGGGCDLTPAYLFEDDAREFHQFWKGLCDRHGPQVYPQYKQWCDDYFFLPARQERRGIGGIFFDDVLGGPDQTVPDAEEFVKEVAEGWLPSWTPIVQRRRDMSFQQHHRDWQLLRRGRYLEFNLLYDRGVKFGINGRIESVMVSAPPLIAWKYNIVPETGSPEAKLIDVLKSPRSWA